MNELSLTPAEQEAMAYFMSKVKGLPGITEVQAEVVRFIRFTTYTGRSGVGAHDDVYGAEGELYDRYPGLKFAFHVKRPQP